MAYQRNTRQRFLSRFTPIPEKYPDTHHFTKVSIGKFYIAVDKNLRDGEFQPINAYRFVDRLVDSRESVVKYSLGALEIERDALQVQGKQCTEVVEKLSMELTAMKKELSCTQVAFMNATKELKALTKQCNKLENRLPLLTNYGNLLSTIVTPLRK